MASLTDQATSDLLDEAREELTGETNRRWVIVLAAFFLGGAVVVGLIAFRKYKAADATLSDADVELATATEPTDTRETRFWARWTGNARAGISTAFHRD